MLPKEVTINITNKQSSGMDSFKLKKEIESIEEELKMLVCQEFVKCGKGYIFNYFIHVALVL